MSAADVVLVDADAPVDEGEPSGYFPPDVWRLILSHSDLETIGRLCQCSKFMWLILSLQGYAAGVVHFPSQSDSAGKAGRGRSTSTSSSSAGMHGGSTGFAALSASTFLLRASWKRAARERMEASAVLARTVASEAAVALSKAKLLDVRVSSFESMLEGELTRRFQGYSTKIAGNPNSEFREFVFGVVLF
jgi:hypothetical protein